MPNTYRAKRRSTTTEGIEQRLGVGVVLGNRFQLVRLLGMGSSTEVWLARDRWNSYRMVAVKVLIDSGDSQEFIQRFADEAVAMELLAAHPNIAKIYHRGKKRGNRYIAMEYIGGVSLDLWIEQLACRLGAPQIQYQENPPLAPELSLVGSLFSQICGAIGYAHSLRLPGAIIHRDIKPSNIMICEMPLGKPLVKVLDFGIARLGRRRITRSGQQIGTFGYMSPEQTAGDCNGLTPASDVFSLGLVLVELLTLRRTTMDGTGLANLAMRPSDQVITELRRLRADVPLGVWQLVAATLQFNPEHRPRDAGKLLGEFQAAMGTQVRHWNRLGGSIEYDSGLAIDTAYHHTLPCIQDRTPCQGIASTPEPRSPLSMHVSGPNLDRGEPCSSPRVAEPQAIQSFVETRSSPRVSPSASMRDTSDLRLDVPPEQVDTTLSDVQVITQQLFVRDDWSELQSLRNTQRLMPFARPLRWFRLIGIIAVLIAALFGAFRLLRWF